MPKGVYRYEYIDDWEKFKETLLPKTDDSYSHTNIEDITDPDYQEAKRICKDFNQKFREYYDL